MIYRQLENLISRKIFRFILIDTKVTEALGAGLFRKLRISN